MQVHQFANDRAPVDPLRAQIGRLIELVGTPKFEGETFRIVRGAVGCEHLTAFAVNEDTSARLVFAANTGPLPVAKAVARKYVQGYWKLDPANTIAFDQEPNGSKQIAFSTIPRDIHDGAYRRDCYTSVKLHDRFTVMRRHGADLMRLNFYRGGRSGRFDATAMECMMDSADLLMSLFSKHALATSKDSPEVAPKTYEERLHVLEPRMPQREREVCAAIALGMTSEAIALELGISINTVLTYRKRAYARLRISCQNELLRLVLV